MNKIVVIGSSNVDFIMKMERLPPKGETITNAQFMQTYGGKGANQAVGAAKAGGEVGSLIALAMMPLPLCSKKTCGRRASGQITSFRKRASLAARPW